MRKFSCLILLLLSIHCSKASSSHYDLKADQVFISLHKPDLRITPDDYLSLSPEKYKRLTGRKLKLKEIIFLKISQRQIKNDIRKNHKISLGVFEKNPKGQSKWHWGGFFLGMLFPIGFVIVLCINDEKRKDRIRSSLFGIAAISVIGVIIGLLVAPISI